MGKKHGNIDQGLDFLIFFAREIEEQNVEKLKKHEEKIETTRENQEKQLETFQNSALFVIQYFLIQKNVFWRVFGGCLGVFWSILMIFWEFWGSKHVENHTKKVKHLQKPFEDHLKGALSVFWRMFGGYLGGVWGYFGGILGGFLFVNVREAIGNKRKNPLKTSKNPFKRPITLKL